MPNLSLTPIAHIHTDFAEKFGVPRQSRLVDALKGTVVFTPAYRTPDALRALDAYSHLWLLWGFHLARREGWSPVVRPPRLGGNTRVGVFATRSPYRPNPIGLSCVRLDSIAFDTPHGAVLHISGADLVNGTPIYDIKPYLPHIDAIPDAVGGFAEDTKDYTLHVDFPPALLAVLPQEKHAALLAVLAQDPRPAYQDDESRLYGMSFAGFEIKFTVSENALHVVQVFPTPPKE